MSTYTFGDDEPAVERLAMVASAYAPASRAFLAANTSRGMGVALDLGCGPAFSTQLLDEVSSPMDLVGLDSSPESSRSPVGACPMSNSRLTTPPPLRCPEPQPT